MPIEYCGHVERMNNDYSGFEVKKDGEDATVTASKDVVIRASEGGAQFKIGSRVAFTLSSNDSGVESLRLE